MNQTGYTVSRTVNIDQFAFYSDRIRSHKETVRTAGAEIRRISHRLFIFHRVIPHLMPGFLQFIQNSQLPDRCRAAPADGSTGFNQREDRFHCLFLIPAVNPLHVSFFQITNDIFGHPFFCVLQHRTSLLYNCLTIVFPMLRISNRQNSPSPLYCTEFSVQKISIRIQ